MFLIGLELYLKECLLMQECIPSGVLFRQAPYPSGVLPDMLSGIKKGSTSQGGDFKSAETPSGGRPNGISGGAEKLLMLKRKKRTNS